MSLDYMHSDTPTLAVFDPRGLAVRTIQYHRRQVAEPLEARVTHQRFDAAGRAVASRDPYLFALAQNDASVPANLSEVFSLSGVALLSDSVDAGWRLALQGGAGQRVEAWDGRGSHSLTEFDELLRPVAVHERGEDVAEHVLERFTYAGVETSAASHNLYGQLIRHDDPAGTLHLNDLGIGGAVLQQTRHFLLDTDTVNWPDSVPARDALLEPAEGSTSSLHYAASGELLRQIDALGNRQRFTYSVAGELNDTRLTLAGAGQTERTLVSDLCYNASGQIESETVGNGVITRHRYEPADGRLIGRSAHKANGTPLQDLKYSYDAAGNVLSLEDAAQPIRYFNNQRIEPIKTYRYDTLDQLIEATGWEAKTGHGGPALPDLQPLPLDPNQVAQYTQTYHYDAGGNLLDLTHVGAQAHGRILTRARYSNRCLPERNGRPPTEAELTAGFDANGNLRELQAGQSLGWDLRNQLSTVRPVVREDGNDDYERYLYDGGGQRVRKLRSSQTSARTLVSEVRYLPGVEIRTHSGSGEILHVINASAGSNSVQVLHWAAQKPDDITNDQVRYSLNDHLQSSALELDQNADLISQEWYYPFGGTACFAARSATEARYKTVRYSGKERDATGLYYYGFRYYAPWLQRWINPDPAGYVDGMNVFSMVNNNPLNSIDRFGLAGDELAPGKKRANTAATLMLSKGNSWQKWREANQSKLAQQGGLLALSDISEKNLTALRNINLNESEQNFLDKLVQQPINLVHFTEKEIDIEAGFLKLRSKKELTNKNISFTEWHTPEDDIEELASNDYVFFSLSIGAPSKTQSAFGQYRYHFPLISASQTKHGQYALAAANDLLNYSQRQTRRFPEYFSELDELKTKRQNVADDPTELLFSQEHMMEGFARLIIKDMHSINLSLDATTEILNASTPEDFDRVLNTFYRPQIMVPKKISIPSSDVNLAHFKRKFNLGLLQLN